MKKMKKFKAALFVILAATGFSTQSHAVEVWHTPSGKSYDVYASLKVGKKGKKSGYYIISYKTTKDLNNQYGLLLEYYDLMAQLYYFHLPKKVRNDRYSQVTVQAFKRVPKSKRDNPPSRRFTKKLSEIKKILKTHRRVDKNRLRAFQSFNQKKYKEAVTWFKKIKNKVPHDYGQLANAHLYLKQDKEALKQLTAGVKKFPKDIDLLNNLALVTMKQGVFYFEKKYEYDPGQMKNAKTILAKARKLDPNNWLTTSNMAVLENSLKNYKAAGKLYEKALKLSGGKAQLYYQVAEFYHHQKNFKKAKKHYKNARKKLQQSRSLAMETRRTQLIKNINARLELVNQKKAP